MKIKISCLKIQRTFDVYAAEPGGFVTDIDYKVIRNIFCSLDHIEKIVSFRDIASLRVARKNEDRG